MAMTFSAVGMELVGNPQAVTEAFSAAVAVVIKAATTKPAGIRIWQLARFSYGYDVSLRKHTAATTPVRGTAFI
jgi:hypothetical protein